jgi:hypothetical protein
VPADRSPGGQGRGQAPEAGGNRAESQTVLDAALEGLAGPKDGSGLTWFRPKVQQDPGPDL